MVTSVARFAKFTVTIFSKVVPVATEPNQDVKVVPVTVAEVPPKPVVLPVVPPVVLPVVPPPVVPPVEPPALPPVVLVSFFVPLDAVDLLEQELRAASDATV